MAPISPASLCLTYDAAHHLLLGYWRTDQGEESLYPSYEQLLAAAKARVN